MNSQIVDSDYISAYIDASATTGEGYMTTDHSLEKTISIVAGDRHWDIRYRIFIIR